MDINKTTEKIIGCAYKVYKHLGFGFLEKVYENALLIELEEAGLSTKNQKPINIHYKNAVIGEYFADIIVNDQVIVELKAGHSIAPAHNAQLINYLKATNIKVGLILNFSPKKVEISRKIF